MSEANPHAQRRLREALKYVSHQWGNGWNRLGVEMREALVRAEILAEISRISRVDCDPTAYRDLVDAMSMAAIQWSGELI